MSTSTYLAPPQNVPHPRSKPATQRMPTIWHFLPQSKSAIHSPLALWFSSISSFTSMNSDAYAKCAYWLDRFDALTRNLPLSLPHVSANVMVERAILTNAFNRSWALVAPHPHWRRKTIGPVSSRQLNLGTLTPHPRHFLAEMGQSRQNTARPLRKFQREYLLLSRPTHPESLIMVPADLRRSRCSLGCPGQLPCQQHPHPPPPSVDAAVTSMAKTIRCHCRSGPGAAKYTGSHRQRATTLWPGSP